MLDPEFCIFLEYTLTKALANTAHEQLKGFWCDGILLPSNEKDYSQKRVNDKRYVIMIAFIGKDGQDEYELTMHFGPMALSRYARALNIRECIPHYDEENWYDIDPVKRKIAILLK